MIDGVWTHIELWARCKVWLNQIEARPFDGLLTRSDKVVSVANLYAGEEVAEDEGHYLIDAMAFYRLRDWSGKFLVPHVCFVAHFGEESDDIHAVYQRAWPAHSGQRYELTVKHGLPQLKIPKNEFKLCEAR